jgi:hypothetical protein
MIPRIDIEGQIIERVLRLPEKFDSATSTWLTLLDSEWQHFQPAKSLAHALKVVELLKEELRCDFTWHYLYLPARGPWYGAAFSIPTTKIMAIGGSIEQPLAICNGALALADVLDEIAGRWGLTR